MRCKNIFVVIFSIFLLSLLSASHAYIDNPDTITTVYEPSGYLNANMNISFTNESLDSVFTDSLGNSISLEDLLERSDDYVWRYYDNTNKTVISPMQILKMSEAEFALPSTTGNFTYRLSFRGYSLFEKTFQITSTKGAVDKALEEKYNYLNSSKQEVKNYDIFVQEVLNEYINFVSLEDKLDEIKEMSLDGINSEDYAEVIKNISDIKVPRFITETVNTNPITFFQIREMVELDALKDIGGGDYEENPQGYLDSIALWNKDHMKSTVSFREITINYGSTQQSILRVFQFTFDKTNMEGDAYFVIKNLQDLRFHSLPIQQGNSSYGYSYVNLNDISNTITFSTTDNVGFLNVPVFISPSLTSLTPQKVEKPEEFVSNQKSKWVLYAIIVFLVLSIALVIYILLQRWYRTKYENYLFKNKNNLYNIMTYIQNSKKSAMPRDDIIKNLKKVNWTGEQINYALQKYEGKKIAGIIDRPFKKVLREMQKSNPQYYNTKV